MAHYLVTAIPREDRLPQLRDELREKAYLHVKPFGKAMTHSLENARVRKDGYAVWEEEDYCSPPLAQEREAALDRYFRDLEVELVEKGQGWKQIAELPPLFPEFAGGAP
jgi:hypothetical protein